MTPTLLRNAEIRSSRSVLTLGIFFGVGLALILIGCKRDSASAGNCKEVLDKIVELELKEKGFHDPALLERKLAEFRRSFATELRECEGKHLKEGAIACVRQAKSAEQISHQCFK